MKIAVSASGSQPTAPVDERFGRAPFFQIIDSETGAVIEVVDNNENSAGLSGVGISSAQIMVDAGVGALLTGQVGPKAYQVLTSAGIRIFTGATGSVADAMADYQAGRLAAVDSQVGRGIGGGRGMGQGMGRGMGRGQGRGGGRGGGRR